MSITKVGRLSLLAPIVRAARSRQSDGPICEATGTRRWLHGTGSLKRHNYFYQFKSTTPQGEATCADLFRVDTRKLHQDFHELQMKHHPDRFATAPKVRFIVFGCICSTGPELSLIWYPFHAQTQRDLAAKEASYTNRAYSVLKDPLTRSKYMVRVLGVDPYSPQEMQLIKASALLIA